jgi:mono/diheme cytochrome c family protein
VAFLACGCRQDMASQPRYNPLSESAFFPDGQSARPLPADTIARGHLREDVDLYEGGSGLEGPSRDAAGLAGGVLAVGALRRDVDVFPFEMTEELLKRGRERFNIFCAVCHDRLGTGYGKVVQRGYVRPPSYLGERLRKAPVGHFYTVITNGHGAMPALADQVPPLDRWAIVGYIRVLQYSQGRELKDLPEAERARLQKEAKP